MAVPVRILGREPVIISNAIEGVLVALLAFGLLDPIGIDSAEEVAVVMAVVSAGLGLYVAYVTKDTLLAAALAFVKAVVPLMAAYGYDLTAEQVAGLLGGITVVFALWHQRATGPADVPSFDLGQHTVTPAFDSLVVPEETVQTAVENAAEDPPADPGAVGRHR